MHSQQSMIIAIYAVALSLAITAVNGRYTNKEECEPVRMKMCNDLDPANYIYTSFPNFMNHSSSEVAEKELSRYTDIIESGCSSVLQMFLCSLYIPICKPRIGKRIPPCRSLCQEARSGCEPLLNSAHIRWPHSMSCDHFPEENSGELCISLPDPQPAVKTIDEVEANRIPSKRTTIRKDKIKSVAIKGLKSMEEVKLVCPANKQILIRKLRHFPEKNTQCCPVDTLAEISRRCNGKQSCDVILDKDVIGAGCVATMKKTSVKYKCVGLGHSVKYRKSIGCRRTDKNGIL